jgi:DNA-binding NtrC family response regulator
MHREQIGMTRILVIDDDVEMRSMLEQTFAAAGHEVVLAADGKNGLREYRAQPAGLVITDIFMPEKEGLETIGELHREFPTVKIIAMTGKPGAGNILDVAKRLGAIKTIEKPFRPDEILRVVEEVLTLNT